MNLWNIVRPATIPNMKGYGQFCPVAKAAEVFAQRWTPLIVRELCFGPKRFSELHMGVPLMSRALLVQRLSELEEAGVVRTSPLPQGKLYGLTPAGESLRELISLMSEWGQRHGQGRLTPEELDPELLVWGMKRQIQPCGLPPETIVLRLEFRGLSAVHARRRYWWMILRPDDVEVCFKAPDEQVDVVISADMEAFVRVWTGHLGLAQAVAEGQVSFSGDTAKQAELKRILGLCDEPNLKTFVFAPPKAA